MAKSAAPATTAVTVKMHDVMVLCLSGKYHKLCPDGQFVLSVSTVVETDTPLAELRPALDLLDDHTTILKRFNFVTPVYAPCNDSYQDHLHVFPSFRSAADSHYEGAVREVRESVGAVDKLFSRYHADRLHAEELARRREAARLAAIGAEAERVREERSREALERMRMEGAERHMRQYMREFALVFTNGYFKIKTNMAVYQRYYVTFSPLKARGEAALLVTWFRSKKLLKRPVNQVRITAESTAKAVTLRNSVSSKTSESDLSEGESSESSAASTISGGKSPKKKRKKKKKKLRFVLENSEPGPHANAKEGAADRIEAQASSPMQLQRVLFTLDLLIEAAVKDDDSNT